jgi:hypothetical protein
VIFEDNEDGDTCYHFNMTILDLDINWMNFIRTWIIILYQR